MVQFTRSRSRMTLVLITLVMAGCGGSSNPQNPPLSSFQPEIVNAPDNFQFQATGLNGTSATVQYNWENSGTQATVNHSSSISGGATLLQLYDDANTLVYSDSLKASANEPSAAGVAGTWKVRVTLTAVQGTLNFRTQAL